MAHHRLREYEGVVELAQVWPHSMTLFLSKSFISDIAFFPLLIRASV